MGKRNKQKPKSKINQALKSKKKTFELNSNFNISFQHLDTTQEYSSSFSDWYGENKNKSLLIRMLECLKGYCQRPLREQLDGKKFKQYGDFPPQNKTKFFHPKFVPLDAEWAALHVGGKEIIIGHIVLNTFFIVFLDSDHNFWLTKRVTSN